MRERPTDLENLLGDALTEWGIHTAALEHVPLGFGDHHWSATDTSGRRWFLTVADLERKLFLGSEPAVVRARLHAAMDTAAHLHDSWGLDFVVAPLRTSGGSTVVPLGDRYALSVFPLVEGVSNDFGQELTRERRLQVLDILAHLHRRLPTRTIPPAPPRLVGRTRLDGALAGHGFEGGGPFAESARDLLAEAEGALRGRLDEFDRGAARLGSARGVVTHGEPHPGNLLWRGGGPLLVDWDTVGVALPERDLWLVTDDPDELAHYTRASGHEPDEAALHFYRLRWDLVDLVEFVDWFCEPHRATPDTEQAWQGLRDVVDRLTRGPGQEG